jgi:AcrR family transcriptional regulator
VNSSRSPNGANLAPAADACRPVGRPRSEAARLRILAAARELLDEDGFRVMTMEAIAERANTSKVTLYKWWSHKAAVVLDAMLAEVSPILPYAEDASPLEALRQQMKGFTRFLRSRKAQLLLSVLAEGVLDEKVGDAFRQHWIKPRRADARVLLGRAIEAGELCPDADLEVVIDALFAPLYYRALVRHMPLDLGFGERVFQSVVLGIATEGARARLLRQTGSGRGRYALGRACRG